MTNRILHSRLLLAVVVGTLTGCVLLGFTVRAYNRSGLIASPRRAPAAAVRPVEPSGGAVSLSSQAPPGTPPSSQSPFVQKGRVWPQLRQTLRTMGDRLEKPGKERLIMIGTLSRVSGSTSEMNPFRLITEFPGKMRLEEAQRSVMVFNGQDALRAGGPPSRSDEDVIESLVFDTIEHFFVGQMQELATRELGEQFRLDDGRAANYADGLYDIYQVTDQIKIGQAARQQPKLYYFNSDTLLLERVKYDLDRNGIRVSVEARITNWLKVNDQQFPLSIARFENGQKVLELMISSVSASASMNDGIFDRP